MEVPLQLYRNCSLAAAPVTRVSTAIPARRARVFMGWPSQLCFYSCKAQASDIAPEPAGHGLPLSKCEAYNRVYELGDLAGARERVAAFWTLRGGGVHPIRLRSALM